LREPNDFKRNFWLKICKKGIKPTGDAGNPDSLCMKAQRLYTEIMEEVSTSTFGDEEEDLIEDQDDDSTIDEDHSRKQRLDDTKSKNCRNSKRSNIANNLSEMTSMFRDSQMSQMMFMNNNN
jgi:hypothetical protein